MKKVSRDTFVMYRSFYDAICTIDSVDIRNDALNRIVQYGFNMISFDDAVRDLDNRALGIMYVVLPVIDSMHKRYDINKANGEKGGRPKKNPSVSKSENPSVSESDNSIPKPNVNDNANENGNVKVNVNASKSDFDAFWKAYPKKQGKGYAEKAWREMKPPLDQVLEALDKQKRSAEWKKDNGQYIPYPAKWLKGKYWENEMSQNPNYGQGEICF